jgi:Cysteine-rich CWC
MRAAANMSHTTCPLCGRANQCAIEIERESGIKQTEPCWCTAVKFDADLLARVPPEKRNLACICAVCAALSDTSESLQGKSHDGV